VAVRHVHNVFQEGFTGFDVLILSILYIPVYFVVVEGAVATRCRAR